MISFLLLLELSLVCACPNDVVLGVYNCLRHVASTETSLSASRDVEVLKSKCLDGSFDVTIFCVQNLRYSCRHDSKRLEMIDSTADIEKMQSAFAYTCDHIEVQVEHANCVSQYKDGINNCCAGVEREFTREKHNAYTPGLYLQLVCSFIDAITQCSERPVRLYCSQESADVTVHLMEGLKPPGCLPYDSSSPIAFVSMTVFLCSALISIIFILNAYQELL